MNSSDPDVANGLDVVGSLLSDETDEQRAELTVSKLLEAYESPDPVAAFVAMGLSAGVAEALADWHEGSSLLEEYHRLVTPRDKAEPLASRLMALLDVETPCLSPIAITDADHHKRASDAADIVLGDIYGANTAHDAAEELVALERAERESWTAILEQVKNRLLGAGVRCKAGRVDPGEGVDSGYKVSVDTSDGLTITATVRYSDLMRRMARTTRSHVEETARLVSTRILKNLSQYRSQRMIDDAVRAHASSDN